MAAYRTMVFLASDDAERDEAVLRKMTQAFARPNSCIYLLYIGAHRVTGFGDGSARGHIANDMQTKQAVFPRLRQLCERFAIPFGHIHIEVGDPVPTIERFVREYGIELLVFSGAVHGSHGKLLPLLDGCPCDLHVIR